MSELETLSSVLLRLCHEAKTSEYYRRLDRGLPLERQCNWRPYTSPKEVLAYASRIATAAQELARALALDEQP